METAILLKNLQDEFDAVKIKPNRLIISREILQQLVLDLPYLFFNRGGDNYFVLKNSLTGNLENVMILETNKKNYMGLSFSFDYFDLDL